LLSVSVSICVCPPFIYPPLISLRRLVITLLCVCVRACATPLLSLLATGPCMCCTPPPQMFRFLCGPCRVKESMWLVFYITYCNNMTSTVPSFLHIFSSHNFTKEVLQKLFWSRCFLQGTLRFSIAFARAQSW
jgi:hypothetical protein